jgi:glycosyltransferase involved in cell wall biosynthesis
MDGAALSGTGAAPRRPHVLFLVRSFGFPEGMAATNRVRLLGRALIEQGADARVLCTRVSERPGEVRSAEPRGVRDGIRYLYTPGTTVRTDSFAVRRYREVRGYVAALGELARLRRQGELDCVYLAAAPETWLPSVWFLLRRLRRLGVPVVVEFNELPGEADWLPDGLAGRLSHLDGISGVVAISQWLVDWTRAEAERVGRRVEVLEVPIVVDVGEQEVTPYPEGTPHLVYSASTEYGRAVTFILRVMKQVWARHPSCRLTVTGMKPDTVANLVAAEDLASAMEDGRVAGVGYVDRPRLLALYREAAALPIPLFDDLRSRARFPSKIGEYLASARPVVTTSVGEIERYLRHGETAYISPPGDSGAFAANLLDLLARPERAAAVGAAGRRLAQERFQYSVQGARLAGFISALCEDAAAPRAGTARQ